MGTKEITYCDRCKQGKDEDDRWFRLRTRWDTYHVGRGLTRNQQSFVLCDECRKAFRKMMNKGETK